jgi:hypothetical protein
MISHYARSLARGSRKTKEGNMGKELYGGLNLMPSAEGFELYHHKNAEQMTTQGWSGCTGRG